MIADDGVESRPLVQMNTVIITVDRVLRESDIVRFHNHTFAKGNIIGSGDIEAAEIHPIGSNS